MPSGLGLEMLARSSACQAAPQRFVVPLRDYGAALALIFAHAADGELLRYAIAGGGDSVVGEPDERVLGPRDVYLALRQLGGADDLVDEVLCVFLSKHGGLLSR